MENWIYKCQHTNCLSLKNRNNQSDFSFHDTGRFQAEKITINSDSRSLENIQDLADETNSFNRLHPIKHSKGVGFSAQEVEQVFPDLVYKEDGVQSIDYNGLVTLCVKELQVLKKKVNELEGVSTPCSVVSAELNTLDTVYINNALKGSTGTNMFFVKPASFNNIKGPTGSIDIIPAGITGEGTTGTSSTNNL